MGRGEGDEGEREEGRDQQALRPREDRCIFAKQVDIDVEGGLCELIRGRKGGES